MQSTTISRACYPDFVTYFVSSFARRFYSTTSSFAVASLSSSLTPQLSCLGLASKSLMRCGMSYSLEAFASEWGTLHLAYYDPTEGSFTIYARLPEIDPEEEEMQQAQLQLQQQQQQNDGEQQQAANPPPPPPQPAQAPRAEHPVARRASPPHVVQRQPPPPPPAGAPVPRSDSARSDTARADRLAKIQRMLEAEASEAETKTKAVPPPARPRNDTAMDEDKPSPFLVQRKPQPPSKASMSRVNPWVGSSHTAATSASARMEVDNEDDYSFDLTPSQELAFNEATLRDLERDLAQRSASPTKRAASPQKQKRKLDTGASAPLPAKRAPIQTKVINLVDSGDDDDEEPPPASSSKPKPVPRHTSRVPSTPVSKVRPHRKALPRERSKTVEAAEVIDLSD